MLHGVSIHFRERVLTHVKSLEKQMPAMSQFTSVSGCLRTVYARPLCTLDVSQFTSVSGCLRTSYRDKTTVTSCLNSLP